MKILKFTTILSLTIVALISCGGGAASQPASEKGFEAIETEMKSEFGKDAYYTELSIAYEKSVGNMINVTVTDAPESLKMGEWNLANGAWNQTAEVSLELPEGTKATDFMFQLGDEINLSTLGKLIEKSVEHLKAEKDLESPVLEMAFVKFPDDGDISNTEYVVMLEPENGGTSFTYFYALNGDLRDFNY